MKAYFTNRVDLSKNENILFIISENALNVDEAKEVLESGLFSWLVPFSAADLVFVKSALCYY